MDVVIVGGGVAGLGTGWNLVKAGAKVTVLERAQAGRGATTASAGMIAAAAELGDADTAEAFFAKRANELWPGFAAELEAPTGISIGYRVNGSLMVMLEPGNLPSGHHSSSSMLTAAQAHSMEPMLNDKIQGALWAPHEAQVDSQALIQALATAFVKSGGKILPNETAVRVEIENGRAVGVQTPFTMHCADAYVLAAGAWTSRLEGLPPETLPPVAPIKGEIVVLVPPTDAVLPKHVVWGNGIYLVPRRGRLLVGATTEWAGFDSSKSQAAYRWLLRQAVGLMPALKGWKVAEHWVGLRPATPDGLPVLGETSVEGLYVASGQYRNGILFAPAVAEVMSRLVLKQDTEMPVFNPKRFEGVKPSMPDFVIETAHKAPRKDSGVQQWHIGS